MRILQVHNQYFSGLGGEDSVVRLEEELLRGYGHEVRQLIVSTSELKSAGALKLIEAALSSVWSGNGYGSVANAVKDFQPDVVHVHNTFPLLSPSVYYAARRNGACVVQTLHNYRITCANGILLRNGIPCEECVGRAKWRGLVHRCYNNSASLSGSVVTIQTLHRIAGTFHNEVDAYIALTSFQRDIVVRDGFPAPRVHVKPNFVVGAFPANIQRDRKKQMVFIGSIRREKGVDLLLDAWTRVRPEGYNLLLLGDGPDRAEFQQQYSNDESVIWMGFRSAAEVARVLEESKYIAVCSRCYEAFGLVLLEAFRSGTPAIVPNHAAFPEIIEGGRCGFLFEPSNLDSLVSALRLAVSTGESGWRAHSDASVAKAGEYSADANYARLMEIYELARDHYSRAQ
jgi:glycosyltransferase involved in cell wall biosynthesis